MYLKFNKHWQGRSCYSVASGNNDSLDTREVLRTHFSTALSHRRFVCFQFLLWKLIQHVCTNCYTSSFHCSVKAYCRFYIHPVFPLFLIIVSQIAKVQARCNDDSHYKKTVFYSDRWNIIPCSWSILYRTNYATALYSAGYRKRPSQGIRRHYFVFALK